MLTLAEELALLAFDARTGKVVGAAAGRLEYGLAGAVLMELLIEGRLTARDGRLEVSDASRTGEPVLDHVLARVRETRRLRDLRGWVDRLATPELRELVVDRLVDRGVLSRESGRVLWVFASSRYPERDPAPEQRVRRRVRRAVLEERHPGVHLAALVSLVEACGLVGEIFSQEELRRARPRLERIASGEFVGGVVSGAFADAQAALQSATTAAITAAIISTPPSSGR